MAISDAQLFLGLFMLLSALGVILARKPVYSALSFLLTLLFLAAHYLQLNADFIAVMQILVYAGAILVMFMFVIVLFQDAHAQLAHFAPKCSKPLLFISAAAFVTLFIHMGLRLGDLPLSSEKAPADFGSVQALGKALYLEFFLPFEAITLLFLVAAVGALYIGRKSA